MCAWEGGEVKVGIHAPVYCYYTTESFLAFEWGFSAWEVFSHVTPPSPIVYVPEVSLRQAGEPLHHRQNVHRLKGKLPISRFFHSGIPPPPYIFS